MYYVYIYIMAINNNFVHILVKYVFCILLGNIEYKIIFIFSAIFLQKWLFRQRHTIIIIIKCFYQQ